MKRHPSGEEKRARMKAGRGRGSLRLFLALILLASVLSARVLLNRPQAGQMLEVLVENESAPAHATLRAPDGRRMVVPFEGAQLRWRVEQAGHWDVEVNGRHYALEVGANESGVGESAGGGAGMGEPIPLALALALATAIGAGLCALAVYVLFMRAPKPQSPLLQRWRAGGQVRLRLRAGTRPLTDVVIADEVGPDWKGPDKRLVRPRLEAGQEMELAYEWTGPMGSARVRFERDGKTYEMDVKEGERRLEEAHEMEGLEAPGGEMPAGRKAKKRKLDRGK